MTDYKSDFIISPELFNTPLPAAFNHLSERKNMLKLVNLLTKSNVKFLNLRLDYNINIIAGRMPIEEIVDVDLNLLKELHHYGAVRTISDNRRDLYDVISFGENE